MMFLICLTLLYLLKIISLKAAFLISLAWFLFTDN